MRFVPLLLILLFCCCAPTDTSHPIDRLGPRLVDVNGDLLLFPFADSAFLRLPAYFGIVAQASAIANREKYRVDVIGQFHGHFGDSGITLRRTVTSQARVRRLLDSLNVPLIGLEGWVDSSITVADLRSVAGVDEKIELLRSGAWQHMLNHPNAVVVGAEDQTLNDLHRRTLGILMCPMVNYANPLYPYAELENLLRDARSEIALDRMLVAMHKRRVHRSVLIIGALHKKDLDRLGKLYHVRITYHETTELQQ